MRSGGRRAVAVALLAGVLFAWPTYVRYFGLHPEPMLAALLIAFMMYLPSLWAIRFLDRHNPEPPLLPWGCIAFVILFAPIASSMMHAVIDGESLPYWVVVGPLEELTKLLPLLLITVFLRRADLSMRDGIVYGALGGLGFAIVEFVANFSTSGFPDHGWGDLRTAIPGRWALGTESHIIWGATAGAGVGYLLSRRRKGWSVPIGLAVVALVMATHGINDLYGKYIGPLAMVPLLEPAQAVRVDLTNLRDDPPLNAVLLVYGAVANTVLMNLFLWPLLARGILGSGKSGRASDVKP